MNRTSQSHDAGKQPAKPDLFRDLYDRNAEYVERRDTNSHSARQIRVEVERFKIPGLVAVLPDDWHYRSVIEIGCATGELLAAFPGTEAAVQIEKTGFDISPLNVATARGRYPNVQFLAEDFRQSGQRADLLILSDILEHVPDDVEFLRSAAERAQVVLINLPLEVCWQNRRRRYGIDDPSGHLRAYSLEDGWRLLEAAGLQVAKWQQLWSHESQYDYERRQLRAQCEGAAHAGSVPVRLLKAAFHACARAVPPFGRRFYPSNLFVSAFKRR
jgi:SAM-dependent methyltransferase